MCDFFMKGKPKMKKIAIIYGESENSVQKKALEHISSVILEQTMAYPPCIKYSELPVENPYRCIYIGTKESNPYIRKNSAVTLYDSEEYYICVSDDSIMIEGYDDAGVLYGCVDFYNKYIVGFEDSNAYPSLFKSIIDADNLPNFTFTSAPSVKNRGIWTWGHVIYNYKSFIDNMMRLKFNTIIIWNDFVPVNAREMIDYAHSCNIKVIWGFSWLWDTNCTLVNLENLAESTDKILNVFETQYAPLGVDGIYFQSFTELTTERIGDVLIADAVTDFVNKTAAKFFDKFGNMELQFGIHATSVREQLEYIKKIDPRIRLYWEDLGSFPFAYDSGNISDYDNTMSFLSSIIGLRENEKFGAVTKGFVCLDWNEFEHLAGSFYIGKCSKSVIANRTNRKNRNWRHNQAYWLANADKAFDTIKAMADGLKGNLYITALVEDGMFEENIMYPVALYSEMLWDTGADLKKLMSSVALRSYVEFA